MAAAITDAKREEEAKRIKDRDTYLLTTLRCLHNSLKRLDSIVDPANKACMFVDKLSFSVDNPRLHRIQRNQN